MDRGTQTEAMDSNTFECMDLNLEGVDPAYPTLEVRNAKFQEAMGTRKPGDRQFVVVKTSENLEPGSGNVFQDLSCSVFPKCKAAMDGHCSQRMRQSYETLPGQRWVTSERNFGGTMGIAAYGANLGVNYNVTQTKTRDAQLGQTHDGTTAAALMKQHFLIVDVSTKHITIGHVIDIMKAMWLEPAYAEEDGYSMAALGADWTTGLWHKNDELLSILMTENGSDSRKRVARNSAALVDKYPTLSHIDILVWGHRPARKRVMQLAEWIVGKAIPQNFDGKKRVHTLEGTDLEGLRGVGVRATYSIQLPKRNLCWQKLLSGSIPVVFVDNMLMRQIIGNETPVTPYAFGLAPRMLLSLCPDAKTVPTTVAGHPQHLCIEYENCVIGQNRFTNLGSAKYWPLRAVPMWHISRSAHLPLKKIYATEWVPLATISGKTILMDKWIWLGESHIALCCQSDIVPSLSSSPDSYECIPRDYADDCQRL
jgi:hypothetical protein